MFLGMSLCLPLAYWQQWKAKKLRETGRIEEPLLGEDVVRFECQISYIHKRHCVELRCCCPQSHCAALQDAVSSHH